MANITVGPKPALVTIEQFGQMFGLSLKVEGYYLPESSPNQRWTAKFQGVEVAKDGLLYGVNGEGVSPEKAIADYAPKIHGQILRVSEYNSRLGVYDTRDIVVRCDFV
jgi:hypothetical protein